MWPQYPDRLRVLIETLWNVKVHWHRVNHCRFQVLIETLWNVKYIRKAAEVIQGFVLIETLWNVKVRTASRVHQELSGINRNIVECKEGGPHFDWS